AGAVGDGQPAGAGQQLDPRRAKVVFPDAVVAGGGDEQRTAAERDRARLVERDRARIGDGALARRARTSGAADGVDVAAAQFDAADRVVAGVGHVQRIAPQAHAVRAVERGQFHRAVDETRAAAAELAQHAPGLVAFEHAV